MAFKYLVGFRITLKSGGSLVSPIKICEDEESAKSCVAENTAAMQKASKENMDFVDFLGFSEIGIAVQKVRSDEETRIVKPNLILTP